MWSPDRASRCAQGQQVRAAAFPEHAHGVLREPAPVAGQERFQQGSRALVRERDSVDECPQPVRPGRCPSLQEGGRVRAGKGVGEGAEGAEQQEGREQQAATFRFQDDDDEGCEDEEETAGEENRVRRKAQKKGTGRDSGREMDCQRLYACPLRHFRLFYCENSDYFINFARIDRLLIKDSYL